MNVLVLHDQVSPESRKDELDALVQSRTVCDALTHLGHEWMTLGLTLDLDSARRVIQEINPDLVFNLVESLAGHGRLIHVACSLLDSMRIPYTGAPAEAMFITSNKVLAKNLMRHNGIPTAPWFCLQDLHRNAAVPLNRYIVKSVWEHASVGLDEDSIVSTSDPETLLEAIESRLDAFGGEGFAEAYIDGREFNLALLATENDSQLLPPAEIIFEGYGEDKPKVVGYRAKWEEDSYEFHHTPRRYLFAAEDAPLIERISSIAQQCWQIFGLRGYARVDFRVDESGQPWVLEVNTNPCLSPDAGFAAALAQAEIALPQAIDRIIRDVVSVDRHATKATA